MIRARVITVAVLALCDAKCTRAGTVHRRRQDRQVAAAVATNVCKQ